MYDKLQLYLKKKKKHPAGLAVNTLNTSLVVASHSSTTNNDDDADDDEKIGMDDSLGPHEEALQRWIRQNQQQYCSGTLSEAQCNLLKKLHEISSSSSLFRFNWTTGQATNKTKNNRMEDMVATTNSHQNSITSNQNKTKQPPRNTSTATATASNTATATATATATVTATIWETASSVVGCRGKE